MIKFDKFEGNTNANSNYTWWKIDTKQTSDVLTPTYT
jgi:hypothetical protein